MHSPSQARDRCGGVHSDGHRAPGTGAGYHLICSRCRVRLRWRRCPGGGAMGTARCPLRWWARRVRWPGYDLRGVRERWAWVLQCGLHCWACYALGTGRGGVGCMGHTPARPLGHMGVTRPRRFTKGRKWEAWAVTGTVWIGAVIDASCFNRDKGVYSLRALSLVFRATSPMSANSQERTSPLGGTRSGTGLKSLAVWCCSTRVMPA